MKNKKPSLSEAFMEVVVYLAAIVLLVWSLGSLVSFW